MTGRRPIKKSNLSLGNAYSQSKLIEEEPRFSKVTFFPDANLSQYFFFEVFSLYDTSFFQVISFYEILIISRYFSRLQCEAHPKTPRDLSWIDQSIKEGWSSENDRQVINLFGVDPQKNWWSNTRKKWRSRGSDEYSVPKHRRRYRTIFKM